MISLIVLAAAAQAAFNPVEFFRGRTQSDGRLKIMLQAPKTIKVDSLGRAEADGTLVLEQVIRQPGKAPRTRYWRLRQTAPNRFEGTLSDAAGPVRIDQQGDRLHIRYKAKDNLDFESWLTAAGTRQVNNRTRVKRFGITVAHVDEVIRKLD
jgi:hypothetical protein